LQRPVRILKVEPFQLARIFVINQGKAIG